jgi:REP element-mobilizing transposase RayT
MVEEVWNQLPMHYPGIMVDSHVVMPNHFHGIIFLVGAAPCGRPDYPAPSDSPGAGCSKGSKFPRGTEGHPHGGAPTAMSLFDVMHRFKSYSTARYRHAVTECGWPPFPARLWQRGYYERIIRGEKELDAARKYILENPMNWAMDKENPEKAPGK